MRTDLILSGIIGGILGWRGIPWVIFGIKCKRGIKSTPDKKKSIEGNNRQKDFHSTE